MSDLTFNGGQNAASFGNQQFTARNFVINNAKNAINMVWDWGMSPVLFPTSTPFPATADRE